jgi:HEAT repeat protein
VKALTSVRGFRDTSVAAPLLADPDLLVRAAAAGAIGSLHTQGAGVVDGLVQAVASDPAALVRKRAAWALGEIGAPSSAAGSTLQAAASSDANPLVRSLAQIALSKLTR